MRPVFLIGFMGSGKTTLARAVSKATGRQFIDLDFYVENRFRKSVREIFATEGEERFRELEARMLREVGEFEDVVVACGGGTPCFNDNMAYMNSRGTTVFLDATDECLHRRLMKGKHKRPLLADKNSDEITVAIREGMARRRPYYRQSTFIFESDLLENADEIAASVSRFLELLAHYEQPQNTHKSQQPEQI